jgi:hypothetical protein
MNRQKSLFRASSARIAKITTKKVQIFILITHFFFYTLTDFRFYSLFCLNILLGEKECERKSERKCERRKGRGQ